MQSITKAEKKAFTLPAELSIHNIEETLAEIGHCLGETKEFPINGGDVAYIDACGLQGLLSVVKEAMVSRKQVYLSAASPYLEKMMLITGASLVLPFREEDCDEPDFSCG